MIVIKKDFMDSILIQTKDFRTNPEEQMKRFESFGKRWVRKYYFAGIPTIKEFFWLFHDRMEEFPCFNILDGDFRKHISCNVYLPRYANGKDYGEGYLLFVSSTGDVTLTNSTEHKYYQAHTCKELLKIGRQIKKEIGG